MYDNMPLQDFFPADLALLGLQKLYSQIGKNSFLVNSPCVIVKKKILTKGKHYILFDHTKSDIKIKEIVLKDLFYYKNKIHLVSEDIVTHRVKVIGICLECPEIDCTRFLVDIDYFIDGMDAKAIRDYCGDCDFNNKDYQDNSNPKSVDSDLLEFEF
jgi:hypothetical protein